MELTNGVTLLKHHCNIDVALLLIHCNTIITSLQTESTHGVVFSARHFACGHRNFPPCYERREQQRYLIAVCIEHERLKLIAKFIEQVRMKVIAISIERERVTLKHDMISLMS
jgi:hypothetical protein